MVHEHRDDDPTVQGLDQEGATVDVHGFGCGCGCDAEGVRGPAAAEVLAALQALLFVSDEALSLDRLAAAVQCTTGETRACLDVVQQQFDRPDSGIVLREYASGWRLTTAPACSAVLSRYVTEGQSAQLSAAALETLAVVAYQQPVTRGKISAIRGVSVDGVLRTLVARGLVEESGVEASGATVFRTTTLMLDKLGIDSLTSLPELAPLLPELETLDALVDLSNGVVQSAGESVIAAPGVIDVTERASVGVASTDHESASK